MNQETDRIVKTLSLKAPRSRVWRAIADHQEFGAWFQMEVASAFVAGTTIKAVTTHPECSGVPFELYVEHIEKETHFSFRWHPYDIDPAIDRSAEPTTLVEFRLEDEGSGTQLTIVESGFDALPTDRRDEAFRMNEGGWTEQVKNIRAYVDA